MINPDQFAAWSFGQEHALLLGFEKTKQLLTTFFSKEIL